MVLPVRIELTTSALPRMRSTTELRQHFSGDGRAYDGAPSAMSTRLARPVPAEHVSGMAGKDKEREKRLTTALRENLKRRKAQTRAIKSDEDDAAN